MVSHQDVIVDAVKRKGTPVVPGSGPSQHAIIPLPD